MILRDTDFAGLTFSDLKTLEKWLSHEIKMNEIYIEKGGHIGKSEEVISISEKKISFYKEIVKKIKEDTLIWIPTISLQKLTQN